MVKRQFDIYEREIIRRIDENVLLSTRQVALHCGISWSTALKRLKKLINKNILIKQKNKYRINQESY